MDNPPTFSLKEYYLWWKKTMTSVPWKRQYLNQEFLKYEQKRINDLILWRNHFYKAKENELLKEVSFYAVPVELYPSWKGVIAEKGGYDYVGLSALQNSPQILTLALIPQGVKKPSDYKLIRITKSRKSYLINEKIGIQNIVIIENWDPLKSDQIYVDVPHEDNHIQKLIKENFVADENISLSFQSPLLSSPHVKGSIGGISLSSLSAQGFFSQELIKTILRMTPPEYRGLYPPEKAYFGGKVDDIQGIKFHLAERPYFDNNYVCGFSDSSLNRLNTEISRRKRFDGEYPIFSTINPPSLSSKSVWQKLLKNFSETEITIPERLEDLPELDIDLTKMNKVIDEDLWLQIVASRQLNPAVDVEQSQWLNSTIERLRKDFDAILGDLHKEDAHRTAVFNAMQNNLRYNIKRLAQSFARSERREVLKENDFNKARNLIVDNFGGFVEHSDFERIVSYVEKDKKNIRVKIIETELVNNPKLTIQDIFSSVKSSGFFKDMIDLQGLLDWLQLRGSVWVDGESKYSWV